MQDHQDHDAALVKYRVAAVAEPNCPQLWNNVGMAFFGKQVGRLACAKLLVPRQPLHPALLGAISCHPAFTP